MSNPYQVVKDFEAALSDYTGAPFVVCVNSCTAALELSLLWTASQVKRKMKIVCPDRTYISVPMVIKRAGFKFEWIDRLGAWSGGHYSLFPYNIIDSACRFTFGMYERSQFQCVSFAANKILGIEQGGAILHDNPYADKWFRRMRFDGRTEGVDPKDDTFDLVGLHCPMLPSIAAQGILRLHHLPKHNDDLVFDYPDLSKHEAFK